MVNIVVNATYDGATTDLFGLYGITFNKTENILRKFKKRRRRFKRNISKRHMVPNGPSGRWLNEQKYIWWT